MDISSLLRKRERFLQGRNRISALILSSYEQDFELRFTHNSTAIEGNTLTLMETKVVLEDGVTVGGKALREIYEVVNHQKAYRYVKKCLAAGHKLDESIVKDIHAILTENIMVGGVYRNQPVRISGAGHTPPTGNDLYTQIKNFYLDLIPQRENLNPIEYAAWTHAEFVRIHPFLDGNGRTARLLMNFQLLAADFLPISIAKEDRLSYYNALETYATTHKLQPFSGLLVELEEKQLDLYLGLIQ